MKRFITLTSLIYVLTYAGQVMALDTAEPYPEGASEYELYMDYFGLGKKRADAHMFSSALYGTGITDRISVFFSPVFSASGDLVSEDSEFSMGVFGTVLDTTHLDIDLGLTLAHPSMVALDFEINLDAADSLRLAGIYIRGRIAEAGEAQTNDDGSEVHLSTRSMENTLGLYWTVKEGLQILQENYFSLEFDRRSSTSNRSYDGSAVGLNIMIGPNIELIASVYLMHESGAPSPWYWGAGIGTIMTIDYASLAKADH